MGINEFIISLEIAVIIGVIITSMLFFIELKVSREKRKMAYWEVLLIFLGISVASIFPISFLVFIQRWI